MTNLSQENLDDNLNADSPEGAIEVAKRVL